MSDGNASSAPRTRRAIRKHGTPLVKHGAVRRSRAKLTLGIVSATIALVLAIPAGYATFLAATFDANTTKLDGVLATAKPTPGALSQNATPPENILILGSDTRGRLSVDPNAEGYRSDVVMLVHLDGDRKNVQILSIPRDTWVDIPCYGKGKINWAMSYGGVACAVDTVEGFLGITIDHFVLINFSGVKNLTEVLDGVTVDNPRAFTSDINDYEYTRYFYEQGPIELRGPRALAFVRERHAFSDGDVSRVKNQQLFVNAVIDKLLTLGVMTNPGKMATVAAAVGELLVVDPGLDSSWIVRTAVAVSPFDRSKLNMLVMPIERTALIGSQYAIIPDAAEMSYLTGLLARDALSGYVPPPQTAVDALDQSG
jgi:LCP family protein required for cell wall assembly